MQKLHVLNMQWKSMENRIYVDTNVFIDLLDGTRPFAKGTLTLIREKISSGSILYINSDTITNAFYIVSRQKKFSNNELLGLMKKVILLFSIVPVEQDDTFEAIDLCMNEENSFRDYEDALQYVCAKNIEAAIILSNDKGFVSLDIEIIKTVIKC